MTIPNSVTYEGKTYKVTFFGWDDECEDWWNEVKREDTPRRILSYISIYGIKED